MIKNIELTAELNCWNEVTIEAEVEILDCFESWMLIAATITTAKRDDSKMFRFNFARLSENNQDEVLNAIDKEICEREGWYE